MGAELELDTNDLPVSDHASNSALLRRVQELERQVVTERATRYHLATQHGINPNPSDSIIDVLPVEIISMIMEELVVKDHLLHLNDLLVKPQDSNLRLVDEYHMGVRRAISGYDWYESENMPDQNVIEGKFVFRGEKWWQWTPATGLQEMWNVINTCKTFRNIGLPLMLSKNTWVLNPVFTVTKEYVQRYWCVRLSNYKGPWSGSNGIGGGGVPIE